MSPAEYTDGAICRSMGLPALAEPGWTPQTLRVLFKPSFDPEVCVTLAGSADAARLSVVALAEMLWHQPFPRPLPAWREHHTVPASVLAEAAAGFAAADPAASTACRSPPACGRTPGWSLSGMAQATPRTSARRGAPPGRAGGTRGAIYAHCASAGLVLYGLRMAGLPRVPPAGHNAGPGNSLRRRPPPG